MTATALPSSTRFISPGNTKCLFVTTISAPTMIPTVAEISATAVKDLTGELSDWSGWSISSSDVQVPDLVSDFVPTIPGRSQAEASSLSFYADKAGVDARTVFTRDQVGYIVFADGALTAGAKVDVFPVRVTQVSIQRASVDGSAASKVLVNYSIPKAAAQNVAIAA